MSLVVIYNKQAGKGDLATLQKAFARAGAQPEYIPVESRKLRSILTALRNNPKATVVAAGGDGTINSVAAHLYGGTCKLGIMPTGTLNHFARTLGIPLNTTRAAQTIMAGHTTQVDIGRVNSHVFVNNASIGFYPRSLRFREEYQQKIGKWPAATIGLLHAVLHPRRYSVDLVTNGIKRHFRTPFVFVGNNEYQRHGPGLGERATLHNGTLALYIVKATHPIAIINALIHTFLTTKRRTRDFAIHNTQSATMYARGHTKLRVACDGESFTLRTPLRFTSEPQALRVIVPKQS